MVSTSSLARRVLVLNFLETRRRSPGRAMVKAANHQSLTTVWGGGSRFDPGPVHVRFVVAKMALRQVSLRVLRFSPACSIPPIHQTYLHLQVTHTRRTKGQKNGSFVYRAALHSTAFSFPFYFLNVNAKKKRGNYQRIGHDNFLPQPSHSVI